MSFFKAVAEHVPDRACANFSEISRKNGHRVQKKCTYRKYVKGGGKIRVILHFRENPGLWWGK